MKKNMLVAFLLSLGLGMTTLAYADKNIDDAVAKVVSAYQKANCNVIKKGIKPVDHAKIVDLLNQRPNLREEYVTKMAPVVYAKMQQCGMY